MGDNSDKVYYFGIIALAAYFIFRLVDQAKIITYFPLDYVNDVSSVLAQLYFLAEFGFHQIVPYWYNGFNLFLAYYPGWFYFALPIYYLTKNLQLTWYLALIIVYILAFFLFLILSKIERFSITKGIFFFFLFFANPIAIGNFIRLGRTAEFFGWLFFIALFTLIIYFKERKIDKRFLLFIPLYAGFILTHPMPLILISLFLLSLFLVKDIKEKIFILVGFITAVIITSFWWVDYVLNLKNTSTFITNYGDNLLNLEGRFLLSNLAGMLTAFCFILLFYFYYKNRKNKKELLFYIPSLILAVIFLFRLVNFMPILRNIQPDSYTLFFLFLGFYLFLKVDISRHIKLKYIAYSALIILPIIFIIISIMYVPLYKEHGKIEKEFNSLMLLIEGRYMIVGSVYSTPLAKAYYSYNAIFYNLSTPFGWSNQYASKELNEKLSDVGNSFRDRDYDIFINTFKDLDLSEIATFGEHCDYLDSLNEFKLVKKTESTCLYKIRD